MPAHSGRVTPENLLENFMETLAQSAQKQKSEPLFESTGNFMETLAHSAQKQSSEPLFESTEKSSVSESFNRLFGREKPVHHLLGGGKSADVLLWRNKRISGSILAGATFTWLLFEWLNYHLLTIICIGLILSMTILFLWSSAANILNSSAPSFPRVSVPDDIFVTAAIALSNEVNRFLSFLQDVASGRDLKTFLVVAGSLFMVAVIGTWCNFLTIIYIGFVAAHILPVLYEKYGDQIDSCILDAFDKTKRNYRRLDSQVRGRIPKGPSEKKKYQ